jgi:hypothetical protein
MHVSKIDVTGNLNFFRKIFGNRPPTSYPHPIPPSCACHGSFFSQRLCLAFWLACSTNDNPRDRLLHTSASFPTSWLIKQHQPTLTTNKSTPPPGDPSLFPRQWACMRAVAEAGGLAVPPPPSTVNSFKYLYKYLYF